MNMEAFISEHFTEIILFIGGIIALLIVLQYNKEKKRNAFSWTYKLLMALGLIFGVVMILEVFTSYSNWNLFTGLLIIALGFSLIIRPFTNVNFSLIIGLLFVALAYLFLGELAGTDFEVLSTGWLRFILAFIVGFFVYMVLRFVEGIFKLFGKLFNWWPFLALLAILCILEAMLLLAGYGSLWAVF